MVDLSREKPKERFTGLAEVYAKHRPGYPPSAIEYIIKRCGLRSESVLVDIGCGTGISTRAFAERGISCIGIEPNDDMLAKARAQITSPGTPIPRYIQASAEATGLGVSSADAVLCAQAFHWFDSNKALAEFERILRPAGWVVLMWNERDESDEFTRAYGDLLRTLPDTKAVEGPRGAAGKPLLDSKLFINAGKELLSNEQVVDEEGLLGRAFSASYVPKEPPLADEFATKLKELFRRYEKEGKVRLAYETSVYTAQKP